MTYDYDQNCQDILVMKIFIAVNPYNLSSDLDFNVPINELLCKLYIYTISRVITFPCIHKTTLLSH